MTVTIGRRELLAALGGAAAAWPLVARAQQQPVRPLIGILSPLSAASAARNIAGFRSGLRDLGYLEGRNVTLALRYGDGAPDPAGAGPDWAQARRADGGCEVRRLGRPGRNADDPDCGHHGR